MQRMLKMLLVKSNCAYYIPAALQCCPRFHVGLPHVGLPYRDSWIFFFFWLRRMHWLMIFIGSVSVVIAGNGLKEILISTFAGSNEMLLGKNSL